MNRITTRCPLDPIAHVALRPCLGSAGTRDTTHTRDTALPEETATVTGRVSSQLPQKMLPVTSEKVKSIPNTPNQTSLWIFKRLKDCESPIQWKVPISPQHLHPFPHLPLNARDFFPQPAPALKFKSSCRAWLALGSWWQSEIWKTSSGWVKHDWKTQHLSTYFLVNCQKSMEVGIQSRVRGSTRLQHYLEDAFPHQTHLKSHVRSWCTSRMFHLRSDIQFHQTGGSSAPGHAHVQLKPKSMQWIAFQDSRSQANDRRT